MASYVYFIRSVVNGLIKIGVTSGPPEWRLINLRTMSPVPLEGMGVIRGNCDKERSLHFAFAHLRVHGEWFQGDDALLSYIARHARAWPKPPFEITSPGPSKWLASQEKRMARSGATRPYLPESHRDVGFPPGYDPKTAPINDDDVVARLRRYDAAFGGDLMLEAAEEIERLRKVL